MPKQLDPEIYSQDWEISLLKAPCQSPMLFCFGCLCGPCAIGRQRCVAPGTRGGLCGGRRWIRAVRGGRPAARPCAPARLRRVSARRPGHGRTAISSRPPALRLALRLALASADARGTGMT